MMRTAIALYASLLVLNGRTDCEQRQFLEERRKRMERSGSSTGRVPCRHARRGGCQYFVTFRNTSKSATHFSLFDRHGKPGKADHRKSQPRRRIPKDKK